MSRRLRGSGERGSATLLVLSLALLLIAVAAAAGGVGAMLVVRSRAVRAADLAALAAADAAPRGPAAACARATLVLTPGLRLTECTVVGDFAAVTVSGHGPGWLATLGPVTAQARAGPVFPGGASG